MNKKLGKVSLNRRSRYTVQAIRDAFLKMEKLKMFNEISIAEVCREADISRSTFYQYYNNLAEVLEDILSEISSRCPLTFVMHQLIDSQKMTCGGGKEKLCEIVRREKKYQGLFLDESLTSKIIQWLTPDFSKDGLQEVLKEVNATDEEIQIYNDFQLNGCLSVIRKNLEQSDAEWEKTRQALDRIVESSLLTFKKTK